MKLEMDQTNAYHSPLTAVFLGCGEEYNIGPNKQNSVMSVMVTNTKKYPVLNFVFPTPTNSPNNALCNWKGTKTGSSPRSSGF